ncbi:MAG: CorA family divalent cation transporter, partial [Acidithiobacillus sp.]
MSAWFFQNDQGWLDVDHYAGPGIYLLEPADTDMVAALDAALGAQLPQLALPAQAPRQIPRLVLDANGVLALRLNVVVPRREPELRRSEEELLQARLIWARDHLILVAPKQHWRRIVRDSLELDPHAPQDKILQRILLTAIYSHESATQRIVAELRELRSALR